MRKLLFVLMALVIAAPAMAAVTITGSSPANLQLKLSYNATAEPNLVRAFALILTVDGGKKITAVTPAKTGESTSAAKGYGIFPGTITIDGTGAVTSYGTPVEPNALPGGPSALNTARVVVALGSLYKGDANKPATTGDLFTVTVDGACNLTVAEEETARGGVVLETAAGTSIAGGPFAIPGASAPEPPTGLAASDGASATQKSLTWVASSGATGYEVWYNNKNDSLPANGCTLLTTLGAVTSYNHVTNHGETTWYWLKAIGAGGTSGYSTGDSGYLTECMPGTVPAKKTRWVTYGRPDCWCYARNCKGDASGTSDGKAPSGPYWVSVGDLNVLKSAWNKLDAALSGNQICADFNRGSDGKAPSGPYAVSVSDLNILKSNWNIVNGPASGLCEATKTVVPASGPMP